MSQADLIKEEDLLNDEEYQKETASLLKRIEKREQMVQLLKIARPEKIPAIRECIASLDKGIEHTEKIMDLHREKFQLEMELEKQYVELDEMSRAIEPELLAYLAEHNPEAYEKLKAELAEIDEEADN